MSHTRCPGDESGATSPSLCPGCSAGGVGAVAPLGQLRDTEGASPALSPVPMARGMAGASQCWDLPPRVPTQGAPGPALPGLC